MMETLLPREPVRLALQAKLSVAREQDAPRLLLALEAYERECLMLAAQVAAVLAAIPLDLVDRLEIAVDVLVGMRPHRVE